MTGALTTLIDIRVDPETARRLVERRTLTSRIARVWSQTEPYVVGMVHWPIAIVESTAESTGRRRWTEYTRGAIDLVSGRIGLLDEDPPLSDVAVDDDATIPPRLAPSIALASWHDYHRDYIDQRRRPMRPPELSVGRVQQAWLEHVIVAHRGSRFLVDPVTHRADPLSHFPWVERHLNATDMTAMKETPCTA